MFRIRAVGLVGSLLAAALLASACAGSDPLEQGGGDSQAPQGTVVIGSTDFTEQLILAEMYAAVLKDRGVKVQTRLNLGPREVVFPALEAGEISALPEYTGALLSHLTKGEATASKQKEVLTRLREELPKGVVALQPAPAQDKDALVVTQETARKYDLQTVSDLKGVADQLVVGGPPEMKTRAVGLPGYKKVYGLEFESFRSLDAGGPLTESALEQGDIDVARMFTTDASIAKNDWVVLKDDKDLVPAQNLIPVIRKDALTTEIRKALNEISAHLTTEGITRLNEKVDIGKQDPAKVARQWLQQEGLIGS